MKKKIYFLNIFFILFTINLSISKQLGKTNAIINESNTNKKKKSSNKRKLDNVFKPIRILIEEFYLKNIGNQFPEAEYFQSFARVTQILNQLINVIQLKESIKLDFSLYPEISENIVNGKLKQGTTDYDLIIIPRVNLNQSCIEWSTSTLVRETGTNRPLVSNMTICYKQEPPANYQYYLDYLVIHHIFHILGFSYDSFKYFPNGEKNVFRTGTDIHGLTRNYIIIPEVLNFAKKYFGCQDNNKINQGIPLENQEENNGIAHWESRVLLGEIMSSYSYTLELIISEFTLILLESSGWYEIKKYTGGLMRFGKNKGCDFLTDDCTKNYKNEFYDLDFLGASFPVCSSGRLSKGNIIFDSKAVSPYLRYEGSYGGIAHLVDYCLISVIDEDQIRNNLFSGNCKRGDNDYGKVFNYEQQTGKSREFLSNYLNETYSENSFCMLVSMDHKGNEIARNYPFPYCYEMFCKNNVLTIKIGKQYIVCPRAGGKSEINGDYEGYIYCPDYNLICTGTKMCNDIFDCIEKGSLTDESSFEYEDTYQIQTSQQYKEFANDKVYIGYEMGDDGICPKDCNQCFKDKKCIKCREGYNFVANNKNDKNPSCKNIDVSIGYFLENYVYYPCLENCAKCNNETLCEKCKDPYYFIKDDRKKCQTGYDKSKYYTTDEGVSYYPCDTNFKYCDECQNSPNSCYKCKEKYYFITQKDVCRTGTIPGNTFTEDGGILYHYCTEFISNCNNCNSRESCTKCVTNYYFIGKDRKNCVTDIDKSEYYTEDGGVSYFPCDTNIENCLKCSASNKCTKCKDGFIFIGKDFNECFTDEKNRTYKDGDYYYRCNTSIPNCYYCSGQYLCNQCDKGYNLVNYKDGYRVCFNITDKKYYELPDGSYELCSNAIKNCDQCEDSTKCIKCQAGYYFLENNYINCRNDLDLREYYSKDGGVSYYPCNKMEKCKYCSYENICDECEKGFYFLKDIKNKCQELNDLEKYYKINNSYYPCDEAINHCNKCHDSKTCYECQNGYKLILEEQSTCYEDSYFDGNDEVIPINDTFYEKCSNILPNCKECDNPKTCKKCENDYFFVNENYKECIHKDNILPKDDYFQKDDLNYFSCSKGVKNCKKCRDEHTCNLCDTNYAILDDNYGECHLKSDIDKGSFPNEDGTFYYSCLDNCDLCTNKTECIKCSDNYFSFEDNKLCDSCNLNLKEIDEELTDDLVKNDINYYLTEYKGKYTMVDFYINKKLNFSISIFRDWRCTQTLLQNDYFQLNTEVIKKELRNNIANSKDFLFCYVNNKFNNYIEIYNLLNNQQVDINNDCPLCSEGNNLEIINNFTNELNTKIGPSAINNIKEDNFNIFDKNDPIFNDICTNFAIETIDLPIKERRELFYLGSLNNKIICNDINCKVESININKLTGNCNCKIQTDFNNLFLDQEKNSNNEYEQFINSKSSINSFLNFKCAKEAFSNIKNNVNLYISCGFLATQIALFTIYILWNSKSISKGKKSTKKEKKKIKSNPPKDIKVGRFDVTDSLENSDEINPSLINEKGDFEKENQEKDIQMFYDIDDEEEDEDDYGDQEKNIQGKDIDSVREREIREEIIKGGGEINEEIFTNKINLFRERRAKTKNAKEIAYTESSREEEEEDEDESYEKRRRRLNFVEEDSFYGDKGKNVGITISSKKRKKKKNKKRDSYSSESSSPADSRESFTPSEVDNIQNDIIQKTEYTSFKEAVKNPDVPFMEYYWKLIQLKQPIINLFSPIKCLKIEESHIPTLVKLMRIIFYFSLNMFFNLIHLEQKYFRKKYKHFDEKYNIRFALLKNKISLGERFTYGLSHAVLSGFISFLVCLIIQSIINFFLFNIKKKLEKIIKNSDPDSKDKKNLKENKEEILQLLKNEKKIYIIFFSIGFGIMLIIFYFSITFAEVYSGGVLDFVAGIFWTFIFLQIIPFIYCLIFAYCRYKGIKDNKEKWFNFGQSIFF